MLAPARKTPRNISKTPGIYLLDWSTIPGHKGKRWQVRVLDEKAKRLHGGAPMVSERFNDRKEAEDWGKDMQAKLRVGQANSGRVSASTVRDEYMAQIKAGQTSYAHKTAVCATLRRWLDETHLTDLSDDKHVVRRSQAWLNDLSASKESLSGKKPERLAPGTRRQYRVHLVSFGVWLEAMEYTARNPFAKITRIPESDDEVREPFTPEECARLASPAALAVEGGEFVRWLVYTGMRLQEATWTRRDHIDLTADLERGIYLMREDQPDREEAAIINARRVKLNGGKPVKQPVRKTLKTGPRPVRLEDELRPWLTATMATGSTGFLFPRAYRTRASGDWTKVLEAVCKAVGVTRGDRTMHCLRHSNVCMLDAAGLGAGSLKKHIGHSTAEMHERYAHHIDRMAGTCRKWDRSIRLQTILLPPQLHSATVCNGCATPATVQGRSSPREDEPESDVETSEVVVLLDDNAETTGPTGATKDHAVCDSTATIISGATLGATVVLSYDYARKTHTECVTQGDVMTFRWASLPLAPKR